MPAPGPGGETARRRGDMPNKAKPGDRQKEANMASKTKTATPDPQPETPAKEAKPKKEARFVALTDEQAAWIASNARPAESPCLCGCGGLTKGRFIPGHDAMLKERLRATIGERGDTPAGSEAAQADARKALETFGW